MVNYHFAVNSSTGHKWNPCGAGVVDSFLEYKLVLSSFIVRDNLHCFMLRTAAGLDATRLQI